MPNWEGREDAQRMAKGELPAVSTNPIEQAADIIGDEGDMWDRYNNPSAVARDVARALAEAGLLKTQADTPEGLVARSAELDVIAAAEAVAEHRDHMGDNIPSDSWWRENARRMRTLDESVARLRAAREETT